MIKARTKSSNLEKQLQIQDEPAQYARKNRPIDENFQLSALRIHKAFINRVNNKRLLTEQKYTASERLSADICARVMSHIGR